MQVYLNSLGCRLNEAELQIWADEFSQASVGVTSQLENANLVVLNTCAVTGEAARKSRQTIRRLHRKNPTAKLVVTGCYASLEKEQAEQLLGVDLIVDNSQKDQLAKMSLELLDSQSMPFAATEPDESAIFTRNKERAFIKIQDGCRYRCTYCIVTVARGEESSRTIEDLISEVNRLNDSGVKEIVLTGVHVGGYGSDLNTSLYELVVAILEQTTIPRIRFASVEPWDLPDNFFELFKNPRLMPHMHLPIQSGSNNILKKMSRRCKSETFLELVNKARSVIPEFNITTDIIVGFPGETEEDFQCSKNIIAQAGFGHVHIFSYSDREGTKAARLPNKIDKQTKKIRSQILHKQAKKIKLEQLKLMLLTEQKILCEGKGQLVESGNYRYVGYTENYFKVEFETEQLFELSNQIVDCKVVDIDHVSGNLIVKPTQNLEGFKMLLNVQTIENN